MLAPTRLGERDHPRGTCCAPRRDSHPERHEACAPARRGDNIADPCSRVQHMSRAASFVLVLVLPVLAACAPHRAPTYSPAELQVDRIAVLDDDGNVIPEELIRATMRPERFRILRPVVGAIAGMTIFAVATMPP